MRVGSPGVEVGRATMIELAPSVARWIAGGILILCLAGLAAYSVQLRRAARAFGDPAVIRQLLGVDLARVPVPRLLVVGIAAASLGVAIVMAANPADREAARGPLVWRRIRGRWCAGVCPWSRWCTTAGGSRRT